MQSDLIFKRAPSRVVRHQEVAGEVYGLAGLWPWITATDLRSEKGGRSI